MFTSCDFEDGFCGWTNQNWSRTDDKSPLEKTGPMSAYHGRAFVFDLFIFFLQSLYVRENIVNISKNVQLKIHIAF